MPDPPFTDRPLSHRTVVLVAAAVGSTTAVIGAALTGLGLRLAPTVLVGGVACGVLWLLRARHVVRVTGDRLTVGLRWVGGFDVWLDDVDRWQVLPRAEAFELRAALRGRGRVAFLPWLPAAAYLDSSDDRVYLVGTRRPDALRAVLADTAPHRETVVDIADLLAQADGPEAGRARAADPSAASATGGEAALLLGVTALFGMLVTLVVLDAATSLPGYLGIVGAVAGPVLGALVVAEAASRTPLSSAGRAALAGVCAGLPPPVAAAVAGVPLAGVVVLALVTVSIALVAATLHPGRPRRA